MITSVRPVPFKSMWRGVRWGGDFKEIMIDGVLVGYAQPPNVFGPGTPFPVGMNLARLSRWFYRLNQWKMTWSVSFTPDDGSPLTDLTADAASRSMRDCLKGESVVMSKTAGSDHSFNGVLTFSASCLVDADPGTTAPKAGNYTYYPGIIWSAQGGDSPSPQDESSAQFYTAYSHDAALSFYLATTSLNLTLDDQEGHTMTIPIYHSVDDPHTDESGHADSAPHIKMKTTDLHAEPHDYLLAPGF